MVRDGGVVEEDQTYSPHQEWVERAPEHKEEVPVNSRRPLCEKKGGKAPKGVFTAAAYIDTPV